MSTLPDTGSVLAARLVAQGLAQPLRRREDYPSLFRRLQPVSPIANTYPGNPPALVKRTIFDSLDASDELRGDRRIVKARFLGGTVGYVATEDLADYAVVFRRKPARLSGIEREVLAAVSELGPITPRLVKEETRLLARKVGPALAKLQRAFLVFEDQTETNWERGWSTFSSAFPAIEIEAVDREQAARSVIHRFLEGHVFATFQQFRDWAEWPVRDLKTWLSTMTAEGEIQELELQEFGPGWVLPDGKIPEEPPASSAHMLHLQDGLVRSHRSELKKRFGGQEILQVLLIDGRFSGAVCGHWRIGPHEVEDIVLELPKTMRASRKAEILKEVSSTYSGERHRILRYDGKPV